MWLTCSDRVTECGPVQHRAVDAGHGLNSALRARMVRSFIGYTVNLAAGHIEIQGERPGRVVITTKDRDTGLLVSMARDMLETYPCLFGRGRYERIRIGRNGGNWADSPERLPINLPRTRIEVPPLGNSHWS